MDDLRHQHMYENKSQEYQVPESLMRDVEQRISTLQERKSAKKSRQDILQEVQHEHWETRAMALYSLRKLRADEIPVELILRALQDEHVMVRAIAVQMLGCLGKRLPVDALRLALQDHDWEVRERGVFVLSDGNIEENVARPFLAIAQQDAHPAVSEAARETLALLDARHATQQINERDIQLNRAANRFSFQAYGRKIDQSWELFCRQFLVLRKYGLAALVTLLTGYIVVLGITLGPLRGNVYYSSLALGVVTTLSAAIATGFTTDLRQDQGREIMLSTPTSLRMVMFCRFLIVIVSHLLLSGVLSAAIAPLYGQGLWSIVQIWLGPMFLVSSLSFAVAMLLGSWFSLVLTFLFEIIQTLHVGPEGQIAVQHSQLWQTNPVILLVAVICFALVILYMPSCVRNK
ncbi:MAG: HEAT repeat domain-containing protein [Ktedonobacteraceae bacterium]|nr:HEAT repeat domain-containing protein [Ktedonobacteraceae bacterium]MBV9712589.1 HEAT repeat domain-containing protein [Ktedonobacteraceae bacterium]